VHSVAPEAPVTECLVLMQRERIRHLPVTKDGAVLGVLTGSLIERHERLLRKFHDEQVKLLFPYPSSY
jgi:signal-transduction protein with cAMP-binding, CBS, and nucleotidyltransferase domain